MNGVRKKISLVLILSILSLNFPLTLADNTSVTEEEKTKVETEVLKLQSNIFNSSKTTLEKLTDEFAKITNYEETGSTKFDISMDESTFFGKGNATLNLNKYSAKASGLDSEISSDIDFKLDYAPLYGSGMNIDLSTFASMISKDSEIYLKLKDLNFKVTDENIGKILEAVKSEFSDNKYVKMPSDENSKMAINALKNFSLTNILTEAESISKTPLLTTYKKDGDKYLLIPTKEACQKYFEVTNRLNSTSAWYEPKSCSDTVYNSMVVKFIKSGDLYLTLSDKENTLGFYADEDGEILNSTLVYDDVSINKFDFIITGKNDDFVLRYEKNKFLNSLLDYGDGVSVFNFDSKLDENNRFIEINSSFNFNKDFTGNFSLKNKKISGMFYSKEKGYDYNSGEYKLKNVFASKVTGTLNDDNTIKNLNAKLVGVSVADKKAFLVGKLNLANGNINYSLNASDNTGKFVLSGNGKYAKSYFKLDSKYDVNGLYAGKINYLVDTRNNKSDGKVYFDVNQASKQVFKLNLETSGTRTYKEDVKIEVPSDYKELDVEKLGEVIYGEQLKKARDLTRINDMYSLMYSIEQYYGDYTEYPTELDSKINIYIHKIPVDVLDGQTINGCTFGYKYEVLSDSNGIKNQKYRLSTCFESEYNLEKAKNDGGIYDNMYEVSNY